MSWEQIVALLNHTGKLNGKLGPGTFWWLGQLLPGGHQGCPPLAPLQLPSKDVSPADTCVLAKAPSRVATAAVVEVRGDGGEHPFPFRSCLLPHSLNPFQQMNPRKALL